MIEKEDLDMMWLTDDFKCVADEIDISLEKQIEVLEDAGLSDTTYYKSLSSLRK
ncbi:MAG: hypothetical protein Q9M40_02975 [Sulfurimonas sp.]|nr:hypothetical protein [Sulfurimonas sp.]